MLLCSVVGSLRRAFWVSLCAPDPFVVPSILPWFPGSRHSDCTPAAVRVLGEVWKSVVASRGKEEEENVAKVSALEDGLGAEFNVGQLIDLQWKLGVMMTSSHCQKLQVLRPNTPRTVAAAPPRNAACAAAIRGPRRRSSAHR